MTEPQYVSQGGRARIAMLIVGLVALIAGAFYAYNGWRSAQSVQGIYDGLGVGSELGADYTQMWIGIVAGGVGLVPLLAVWIIAAARK